jgi:hypothetical protein
MLLVFFARMVDDLVASVVASAAERGKALIGQAELEAHRVRVELPALPPAVHRVDGNWEWNGRQWAWQAGHRYGTGTARLGQKRAELAHGVASSRRPNLTLLTASGMAR